MRRPAPPRLVCRHHRGRAPNAPADLDLDLDPDAPPRRFSFPPDPATINTGTCAAFPGRIPPGIWLSWASG